MSEWAIPNEFELPKGDIPELRGSEISPFNFEPPGPVGEAYMYGLDPIEFIMGPVGSGKTTASIFRIGAVAMRMPICRDGVYRCRGAILHQTRRALDRTFLPSLFKFFPRDTPGFTIEGGQDRPFCITMRFRTPSTGKILQIILDGFGIGEHRIEDLLRGYEANLGGMVESDLMAQRVPSYMYSRVAQGRYPGRGLLADPNAAVPGTVFGDLNPPNITSWIHTDFVETPRDGYVLHRQPSGLSDQAENRRYTSREDYEKLARTLPPDDVRRLVHGDFGLVGDGALVHEGFDYTKHVRDDVTALDMPLLISADAGGSPAMAINQYTPAGKFRVLDEVVAEPGTGIMRFAEMCVDVLRAGYAGLPIGSGFGDPSAFYGADRQAGELTFMEILSRALSVQILPTPTNDPHARRAAVDWFLRHPDDGRNGDPVPHFLIAKRAKRAIAGYQGGFLLAVNTHDQVERIRFVKNKFSHICEAIQYGCYGARGHAGLVHDTARAGRPGNVLQISAGRRVNSEFNL